MYTLSGSVIHGKQRGKKMGFPTANLPLTKEIPQGIYISETVIDGVLHPSLTFIGNATTFGEREIVAETHILFFDGDLYNKEIEVTLLSKIRGNKKFESMEKLIAEMEEDKKKAVEYFKKRNT